MNRIATVAIILSTLLPTTRLLAVEFQGRVVGVSDGDTIMVLHDGKGEKIRLYGIDCPEKRQAYGQRAKQCASQLSFGKMVKVDSKARDRYGRTVGVVILPDGRSLNDEMVREGVMSSFGV